MKLTRGNFISPMCVGCWSLGSLLALEFVILLARLFSLLKVNCLLKTTSARRHVGSEALSRKQNNGEGWTLQDVMRLESFLKIHRIWLNFDVSEMIVDDWPPQPSFSFTFFFYPLKTISLSRIFISHLSLRKPTLEEKPSFLLYIWGHNLS